MEESKNEEEEIVFNDDDGTVKYTDKAILKPIEMPAVLVEFAKRLPPLPENPIMIPPKCPAPPRNFNQLYRR